MAVWNHRRDRSRARRGNVDACAGACQEAQHPRHLGRRHRARQHQRLQHGHHGLQDAQHRPHRERRCPVHRFLRAAELHRRACVVHPRTAALPHRAAHHRHARLAAGDSRLVAHDRGSVEAAGLRHRPVRQEPPRRPRLAPAHGARLRRVSRQPLPPERGGGTRDLLLSERPGVQEEVRPARCVAHLGRRQGRADDRGHRCADDEAHGNHRRGDSRGAGAVRRQGSEGRQTLLRVAQHDPHACLDTSDQGVRKASPASASTRTAWSCTTRWSARY